MDVMSMNAMDKQGCLGIQIRCFGRRSLRNEKNFVTLSALEGTLREKPLRGLLCKHSSAAFKKVRDSFER